MCKITTQLLLAIGLAALAPAVSAQSLSVAPASVSFSYGNDGKLPAVQTVKVTASSGTPDITVTPDPSAPWLVITPLTGKSPAVLTLRVNPSSLSARTYTATISIAASGFPTVPLVVTLVVKGPPPALTTSIASATFAYVTAASVTPVKQPLTISSSGSAVSVALKSSVVWLKLSKDSGIAVAGSPLTIDISIDPVGVTALTPKSYPATITITPSDASVKALTVNVTLTVTQGLPSISAVWPSPIPVNSTNAVLTVSGSNFFSSSVVKIGAATIPSTAVTFVSGSVLLVAVPASVLSAPGSYNVTVQNGGVVSTPAVLQVTPPGPAITSVVSVASYLDAATGTVSPGEIITIFGSGLGPADLTNGSVSGGAFQTQVADTRVEFQTGSSTWAAAPLIFVRADQINAVVPFGVSAATTQVRVTADASSATPQWVTKPVTYAATHPAVFTVDASGTGQAIVLNLSASGVLALNSKQNPAPRGKDIAIYVTGAGALSPSASDGEIITVVAPATTPATTAAPATVSIDGTPCVVRYSGAVEGAIAGLVQVNCTVDANQPVKDTATLLVTYGGVSSQSGITVAIK